MQDDSLPQGLEFVSVQQTVGAGFTCTNPGVGSNGVVSCTKGVMAAGRTGWMKFWSNNEYGLFGATINLNSNAAANTGSFNQGHNLHKLTLAPNATLTIPVVIPFC